MNYTKSLIICFAFFLCQALFVFASPINDFDESTSVDKRSFPPFEMLESTIYFYKPKSWNTTLYAYIYSDNDNIEKPFSEWPGQQMYKGYSYFTDESDEEFDYYSIDITYGFLNNSYIIFNDGKNQVPSAWEKGFDLVADGVYDETGIIAINEFTYYSPEHPLTNYGNYATIIYHPRSRKNTYGVLNVDVYAHYKIGDGEWNSIPGKKMNGNPYTGYYTLTIDLKDADEITICFNDGKGTWDNNHGENYIFKKFQNYIINKIDDEDCPLFN